VAQAFGIPVSTVMDWATRYRRCGSDPKRFFSEPWRQRKETVARRQGLDPRRERVLEARRAHPEHGRGAHAAGANDLTCQAAEEGLIRLLCIVPFASNRARRSACGATPTNRSRCSSTERWPNGCLRSKC
jgi:hypothetical protein